MVDTTKKTPSRVAVLDIGTNTLLLLIAELSDTGALLPVYDACEFGRLGQGLDRNGVLAEEAITRSLDIVNRYRDVMDAHGVDKVAAVGTEALREAGNAAKFIEPATAKLGTEIRVISGEAEANLVYRAVSESFPELAGQALVIGDVGGGSTEIISVSAAKTASVVSLPIGSVRMTERHLADDPPSAAQIAAMTADIDSVLATLDLPDGARIVGTAGTATAIAAVELGLAEYDGSRVNGFRVSAETIGQQLQRYWRLSVAERRQLPGLEPQRADVIAAGVTIFARLLHQAGTSEILISDRGVRWGLAYELAASF